MSHNELSKMSSVKKKIHRVNNLWGIYLDCKVLTDAPLFSDRYSVMNVGEGLRGASPFLFWVKKKKEEELTGQVGEHPPSP